MKKSIRSLIFAAMLVIAATFILAFSANAADVTDGTFNSTEGTLNWAYLENGCTLAATGNTYEEKTLIIYGSGTAYTYAGTISSGSTATQYLPWGAYRSTVKHIVIEASSLTSFVCFRQMGGVETIVIPSSINILDTNALYGLTKLKSVRVLGSEYPEDYGDNIFDFRNIETLKNTALYQVAQNVSGDITVLFGENTTNDSAKQNFCNGSSASITIYCKKDSVGEAFANTVAALSSSSSTVASDITVMNYPETVDPSTLNKALVFEGYQVRTKVLPTNADASVNAENGLRTLYCCDSTVVNEGLTLTEYGTILSTKENAEYAVLDQNLEVTHEKVIKSVIYKNGEIVALTLKSEDEGKVKFATTLINITKDNYSAQICARGYEVWTAWDGTSYVLYSDSYDADEAVYYPSLSDVTVNSFANGLINSADQDENKILWAVLDTCRAELTAGENINATRVYALEDNVITVSSESTDADFVDNDTRIHVFETLFGETVAIVTGTGKTFRTAEMLNTFGVAADVIVYDDGILGFGFGDFKSYTSVKHVVYADTVKSAGTEIFHKTSGIVSVSKVKTERVNGLIDLSYLEGIGFNGKSYMFAEAKANIEYIHLPVISDGDNAISIVYDFRNISTLKAV